MAYKLLVSKDAHSDLDEITGYIAGSLCNIAAAISFLNDVENTYRYIVENASRLWI